MFPYKPPDVDDTANNNRTNFDGRNSPTRDQAFIEMTIMPRPYTGLETHYAETPLSHVNPEDPPPSTYEATRITEGWEAGSRVKKTNPGIDPVSAVVSAVDSRASGAAGPTDRHGYSELLVTPSSPTAQVTSVSITTNERDLPVSAAFLDIHV